MALQKIKTGFGVRDIMEEAVFVINDGTPKADVLPALDQAMSVLKKEMAWFEEFIRSLRQ